MGTRKPKLRACPISLKVFRDKVREALNAGAADADSDVVYRLRCRLSQAEETKLIASQRFQMLETIFRIIPRRNNPADGPPTNEELIAAVRELAGGVTPKPAAETYADLLVIAMRATAAAIHAVDQAQNAHPNVNNDSDELGKIWQHMSSHYRRLGVFLMNDAQDNGTEGNAAEMLASALKPTALIGAAKKGMARCQPMPGLPMVDENNATAGVIKSVHATEGNNPFVIYEDENGTERTQYLEAVILPPIGSIAESAAKALQQAPAPTSREVTAIFDQPFDAMDFSRRIHWIEAVISGPVSQDNMRAFVGKTVVEIQDTSIFPKISSAVHELDSQARDLISHILMLETQAAQINKQPKLQKKTTRRS